MFCWILYDKQTTYYLEDGQKLTPEIMYNTYPLLMCDELTKIASYEAYNGDITNYMNAFNNLFSNIISAHEFIMLLEEKKVTKNMTDEMYYQYKRITK